MQTHRFQDTSWSLQSKIKGYISGELYLSTTFYDLDLWWKKSYQKQYFVLFSCDFLLL